MESPTFGLAMMVTNGRATGESREGGEAFLLFTLVASCLRGALPPVDLRAVCLVRAMF